MQTVLSVIFKLLTFFQDVIEKRNHFLFSLRPYTFRLTSALTICTACNLYFYFISFATVCLFFHIYPRLFALNNR